MMKKVKYIGELPAFLPTLGLEVEPGDIIEVPDDFLNANFENVKETSDPPEKNKKGSDK
jgi:hypothetical protein